MPEKLSAAKGLPKALKSALSAHLTYVKHLRYQMKLVSKYAP